MAAANRDWTKVPASINTFVGVNLMDPAPQPAQPTAEDLLTLANVRAHCQIGRTTLWRWCNEQGLRTVSVLGITRIRRRDLEAFLERHEK